MTEGVLAKSLFFQFKDRAINPKSIALKFSDGYDPGFWCTQSDAKIEVNKLYLSNFSHILLSPFST
jgi:hypothetical protein